MRTGVLLLSRNSRFLCRHGNDGAPHAPSVIPPDRETLPPAWRRPSHAIPGHAARSRAGIPAEQPFPAETTPRRLPHFRDPARKSAPTGQLPKTTCTPPACSRAWRQARPPAGHAVPLRPVKPLLYTRLRPATGCRLRRRPGCCCCGCEPVYRPRPEGSGCRKPPCSSACSAERHPYSLCPPVRAPEKGSASA